MTVHPHRYDVPLCWCNDTTIIDRLQHWFDSSQIDPTHAVAISYDEVQWLLARYDRAEEV